MPLFSVIVPMYNVEKYARQCIESILSQSFEDFELIIVNDGAKDSTPQIIDEYAKKDNRIVVINKENGGLVSARKAGAEIATGDYVVIVDGDDWIHQDCLLKFSDAISNNSGIDIFCCNCFYVSDSGETEEHISYKTSGLYDEEYIEKRFRPNFSSFIQSVWGKAYKRELYTKFQMRVDNAITIGEDESVVYPMLYEASSIFVLSDCLIYYRYNPRSLTKNRKKEWPTAGLLARVKHFEESFDLDKYNIKNQLVAYVVHATINQCLSYFKANPYNEAKEKTKKLLNDESISKYITKNVAVLNKKERIAKVGLEYKLYPLIKLYSLFW